MDANPVTPSCKAGALSLQCWLCWRHRVWAIRLGTVSKLSQDTAWMSVAGTQCLPSSFPRNDSPLSLQAVWQWFRQAVGHCGTERVLPPGRAWGLQGAVLVSIWGISPKVQAELGAGSVFLVIWRLIWCELFPSEHRL
jgi:hypothetical protein